MSSSMPVTPPGTSQGTIPITSPHDSASERECTRSEQYGLLLLGCGIGYPLWKPTPRCTREAEYIVSIGDVGIISDGLPFNTLFNITQPIHSLANKDGVPEGVHPPCFIDPRWVTVDDKYHPKGTTLIRPKNAVSCQAIQGFDGSSVYSYTLTDTHGALLSLPGGGVLENLERKGEFRQRIKKHWHQWYDFSEKQGYLEEHQALYIVTGVERCSSWAIAAWDYAPTDCTDSGTLKLSVNESAGKCSWTHSIARCETQSFGTPSGTEGASALKQTVFVRGFWINKFHGEMDNSMLQTKPLSMRLGGRDKGLDGGTYFWGNGGSAIGPSSGPSSMSTFNSGSGPANGGYFDVLAHTEAADHLQEPQVYRFSVDNLDFLFSAVASPCELINRFAFIVLSRINPLVSNTGCVVFSHDDDWINIVQEYDDGFPTKMEFFRNISFTNCRWRHIRFGPIPRTRPFAG
ncbi:hypothetical protein L218DRAFT_69808 [Marasmius fiardii PR-910]|nr:hypothetical protein L218DRAFT_69808 [Marasmius fiardii PR-910]